MALKLHRYEYDPEVKKARREFPWQAYMPPRRVAPHVWLVSGHYDYGDYLIDTGDGLILIDTPSPQYDYLLIDSIWRAGFDPRDIKLLLLSHWHGDHDGCAAIIKEMSGCKLYMSKQDHECKLNPPPIYYEMKMSAPYPYEPDEFYSDDKSITLGNITIKTVLTPGHTPGVTSFFFDDTDDDTGVTYHIGMHGGIGIDAMRPGGRMAKDGINAEIRDKFIDQCWEMAKWDVDITLGSHLNQCGMGNVFKDCKNENDYAPFVDNRAWPMMLMERRCRVMAFRAGADDYPIIALPDEN